MIVLYDIATGKQIVTLFNNQPSTTSRYKGVINIVYHERKVWSCKSWFIKERRYYIDQLRIVFLLEADKLCNVFFFLAQHLSWPVVLPYCFPAPVFKYEKVA